MKEDAQNVKLEFNSLVFVRQPKEKYSVGKPHLINFNLSVKPSAKRKEVVEFIPVIKYVVKQKILPF